MVERGKIESRWEKPMMAALALVISLLAFGVYGQKTEIGSEAQASMTKLPDSGVIFDFDRLKLPIGK